MSLCDKISCTLASGNFNMYQNDQNVTYHYHNDKFEIIINISPENPGDG